GPSTILKIFQIIEGLHAVLVLSQPCRRLTLCPPEAAWTPRVRPVANQDLNGAEVVATGSQHQGRLIGIGWAVNFSALVNERLNDLRFASLGCELERGHLVTLADDGCIRASVKEQQGDATAVGSTARTGAHEW